MTTVILAEKPSQAKAYAEAFTVFNRDRTHIELKPCQTFPDGAIITWGIGHLVELCQPEDYSADWKQWSMTNLPILPETYKHKVAEGKKEQFAYIKKLFNDKNTKVIINATDVDREGSNIFYSIYDMTGAKNKTIKRLWINSLEADEVKKGFQNLRDNQQDLLLYDEAKARQISDWLVGMNFSRLYTILMRKKGYDGTLPIGRVQTPTIHLIYQRQMEIENFVPKPFYELVGEFKAANGTYKGKAKVKSEKREEVEAIVQKHGLTGDDPGFVLSVTKKEKKVRPPKLHALSTLQSTANRRWKYSPADVLKTVQTLYEKKIVSYPRTDTQFITENEFAYLVKHLPDYMKIAEVSFTPASLKADKRFVDNKKVQEHYAIIPTKTMPKPHELAGMTDMERNIYFEVLNTALAMFHDDYRYEETKVETDVKGLVFETSGNTEKDKGWKVLFAPERKKDEEPLPVLNKGEGVNAKTLIHEGQTTPPKPYTEGQLIQLMKTCGKTLEDADDIEIMKEVEGLGTEATRSGIIETIKKHQYIAVEKNIVRVTDKGVMLCEAIEGTLLASPTMTAKWEAYLKKVGTGTGSKDTFLANINKFVTQTVTDVPNTLSVKTLAASSGNKASSAKGKGATSGGGATLGTCPACKKGEVRDMKTFYGCSAYQDGCKFSLPVKMLGKKLTKKNLEDLMKGKKTALIKGMTSKAGKPFDAHLVLRDGQLKFEFPQKKTG